MRGVGVSEKKKCKFKLKKDYFSFDLRRALKVLAVSGEERCVLRTLAEAFDQ